MRFLIDNNLSPVLVAELAAAGHDAVHVRDYGLHAATDQVVLARARGDNRVLISADTDFGTLLAKEGADRPSILPIRRLSGRRATEQASIILANLDVVTEDLDRASWWSSPTNGCASAACPSSPDPSGHPTRRDRW
jgi:predicted nuclease of predicted toxin-antitoxin system